MADRVIWVELWEAHARVVLRDGRLNLGAREALEHLVRVITIDGGPARCGADMLISSDGGLASAGDAELVYVAAFWGDPERAVEACSAALPWIAAQHERGARVCAVSTGSFLLAAAGLLRGRTATTYPPAAASFRRLFGDVGLEPHRALTSAGRVSCAAGINSGCDLVVSMIEQLFGREIARSVSDDFLVDFHRSYRVATFGFDAAKYHGDEDVVAAQRWLESRYDRPLELRDLAEHLGMSPRTLTRRFTRATGALPSDYLRHIRVAVAEDLLRDSALTVETIAQRVGYRSAGAFSDAFLRETGRRPAAARP